MMWQDRPTKRATLQKKILDLLSWDGTLLILAEHPESLLVALLRGVVVVHVGQDIAELLNASDLVLLIHSSIAMHW